MLHRTDKEIWYGKCNEAYTPMATSTYLDLDEKGKSVDESRYRGMIGSLLYLTTSRLDIILSVYLCARYQSNPKESHLVVVKRIIKYLKGTTNVGLLYPKGISLSITGFSDSDFAGCKLDKKKYKCDMPPIKKLSSVLELQEASLCRTFNYQS